MQKDELCPIVKLMFYSSSIVPPSGEQTYSECCRIHWAGDFIDIPAPHYHVLSNITVSKDKVVNLN